MRKLWLIALALIAASCITFIKPPVDPPKLRAVAIIVLDAETFAGVAGAVVHLDNDTVALSPGLTNAEGYTFFEQIPDVPFPAHLWVTAEGFTLYDTHIAVPSGPAMFTIRLLAPKPPPSTWAPTREQMTRVMANFCNLTDSTGRPIFTSSLAAMPPATQDDWIAREKAAGGTHYVLSISAGYTNYPPEVDFFASGRMAEWLTTLDRVLAARLVPVVFLDDGGRDPGVDYFRQVLSQIPASYYSRVVWVAGWETVKGDWTSRQFRDNNDAIRALIGPDAILAAHLGVGRLSFSSNPVETDDPWSGDEMACYRTGWGGDRRQQHPFDVFLYQTEPYRQGDAFNTDEGGKGERAEEVATRALGTHVHGAPDWFDGLAKRPTLIAYETVAYHFIRGQATSEYAREVATFFQRLGYQGFGNGLPK